MTQGSRKSSDRVGQTLDRIVAGIIDGPWREQLPPQDELALQCDVSRTVAREALSMLRARDMLDVRSHIGTRVRPADAWRIVNEDVVHWRLRADPDPRFDAELVALHRLIGPPAAAQAAAHASAQARAELDALFDALRASPPGTPGFQAARELLAMQILTASGNSLFAQLAPIVGAALGGTIRRDRDHAQNAGATVDLHGVMLDAIRRAAPADAHAASLALIEHLHGPAPQDAP